MKIYLAGGYGKQREKALYKKKANRLFSYFAIIAKDQAFDALQNFQFQGEMKKKRRNKCQK